jgi:hypothetical protein
MGKYLLFILLIGSITGCNSDTATDESPKETEKEKNLNPSEQIVGTWKIVKAGDEDLTNHPEYNAIRHVFAPDSTWVLSQTMIQEDSTVTAVTGGFWYYDEATQELVTIGLPDSTEVRSHIVSISEKFMEMMSASKRKFVWERVK